VALWKHSERRGPWVLNCLRLPNDKVTLGSRRHIISRDIYYHVIC